VQVKPNKGSPSGSPHEGGVKQQKQVRPRKTWCRKVVEPEYYPEGDGIMDQITQLIRESQKGVKEATRQEQEERWGVQSTSSSEGS
jgi:hypothetical protein